ncbi:DUF1015 domain-containing protein [Candidatus Thiodictyon syntrophicum]|jgi:uncharacterized protein (DUF1015 family)|uniref:DUF1015 domain-containing protein n=1 Tax=Candidatus Thiodictyon syntrophicum TaxID=1166950 RepID=A0A2K8U6C7_9GAMM|nr:DUF1015 family protein [Candidatus Thiodictyon syntrophicum]AUB81123.1 hypothetical protein THSYN_09250 [Candidatus Thiodictyon syntrophicum]
MPLIKPFAGLCPAPGRAAAVAAPPYDVMNAQEARTMVAGRPLSFLHISRPEVDLPPDTDPYAPAVYAKARENLERLCAEGVLVRDPTARYYCYRLTMGRQVQTGLVAAASVAAYDAGRIKKHEFTRPVKEDDRVRQIDVLNAQTGPAFLVYRATPGIDQVLTRVSVAAPEVDFTAPDGVRHELWAIADQPTIDGLTATFAALDALYIADGHHRSAAASRVAAARRAANPDHTGDEPYNWFLSVLFPHDQMQILPYNRLVRDLQGKTPETFLGQLADAFTITPAPGPIAPQGPGQFGMYLAGRWFRLDLNPARIPAADPVRRLDVSLLQDQVIGPLLGIADPRRDERIDFVGGIRGLGALQERVDSGELAVAFSLYPTPMDELMAVADLGEVMPPKSTWFEPKLADGLVSHCLD